MSINHDKIAEEISKANAMHSCNYLSALPESLFLPSDKLSGKNETLFLPIDKLSCKNKTLFLPSDKLSWKNESKIKLFIKKYYLPFINKRNSIVYFDAFLLPYLIDNKSFKGFIQKFNY